MRLLVRKDDIYCCFLSLASRFFCEANDSNYIISIMTPFWKAYSYSLNQSIFFEKYITIARMINSPKLPANNAKVSSWISTKI